MAEEKKEVKAVVESKAIVKKTPAYKKFFGAIAQEDGATLKDYILMDVIVPAIKRGIEDVVHVWLFGNGRRSDYDRASTRSTVSYRSYYDDRDKKSRTISTGYNYDDIILASRMEAEKVLQSMDDLIDTYGIVSVADYYDLVDVTSQYTDNHYGWTDIRNARVVRVSDGYMIKLPKALPIN